MKNEGKDQRNSAEAGRKRPYTTPRLTEYGSVAKLTQGSRTRQQDSPAGTSWKRASCL